MPAATQQAAVAQKMMMMDLADVIGGTSSWPGRPWFGHVDLRLLGEACSAPAGKASLDAGLGSMARRVLGPATLPRRPLELPTFCGRWRFNDGHTGVPTMLLIHRHEARSLQGLECPVAGLP